MSRPIKRTAPASGFKAPPIREKRVVLPAPFGPTTPSASRSATLKEMASATLSWPKLLERRSSSRIIQYFGSLLRICDKLKTPHSKGHAAAFPSSAFGASPLRSDPSGDRNALAWLLAIRSFGDDIGHGPDRSSTLLIAITQSTRAGVKVRAA